MTAIKITTEHKTILDFGDNNVSQTYVMNKLKSADFLEFRTNDKGSRTYLNYSIKVGIYNIEMNIFPTQSCGKTINDYKDLSIFIFEGNKQVSISKDNRFSSEPWVKANKKMRLKTHHLTSAILLCSRLNSLKAFL